MTTSTLAFDRGDGLRYGALGFALAFVALPLYVILPNHYAREFGVPLATLGAILLGARLTDALVDPLIGRWSDRLHRRSSGAVLRFSAAAALVLALGFGLLFYPQALVDTRRSNVLLATVATLLVLTYGAFSALTIAHQSWGAMLGGDARQRSRIVGWREGFGLAGVVLASLLPGLAGLPATIAAFALALAIGWVGWSRAPRPTVEAATPGSPTSRLQGHAGMRLPLRRPAFRRLLGVFMINGIASAIPATLVLFFVQDRLQAAVAMEPVFLGAYFVCAALAIPVWLRLVARAGLVATWMTGMGLAIAVFAWSALLGAGDAGLFLAICALSGIALGADLVVPGALLAGLIAERHDQGSAGAYFGWWNVATKLNLALAAGVALPLLGLAGYVPGAREPEALAALTFAYCLLPCALKVLAFLSLWALFMRDRTRTSLKAIP